MDQKNGMNGIFSILMDLVKSNEEEEEVRDINEQIEQIQISDDDDDGNDLDVILEENIIEQKIKGLSMENDSNDDISELIGLPKQKEFIYDEQLKVVQNALEQNRKLKKMLQSLEWELLLLKRQLDKQNDNAIPFTITEKLQNVDFYGGFSAPYFKSRGFPCPVNSDQSSKEKNKPNLYQDNDIMSNWEEEELNLLEQSIRDVIVQDYFSNLEETGNSLKGEQDSDHKIMVINEVTFIRTADLLEVFKKYDENALDWDKISVNFDNPHTGRDCKLMWDLYLKPSIRKDKWTRKEETSLVKVAKKLDYQDWDTVAVELGSNRTAYQCFSHYQQHLCKIDKKWSDEDMLHFNTVLRLAKQGDTINWSRIKYFIDNSDFVTIYNKWYKTKCITNEEARKGKFNMKEDKFILCAVNSGIPLHRVHLYLQSRNRCQIRDRYTNYLDVKDRKYGSWTSEEDTLLLKLIKEYGEGQWAKIATHFVSRSRTQIRQHYENLKKYILKNPNVDLEKIKRRKNIYLKRNHVKRLKKDIKHKGIDMKLISSETDFTKEIEDIELIKHFLCKKSVFKGRKSIGNTFTTNSKTILKICETFDAKLSAKQINSFVLNDYRKHLHEYIFGSIQFVQKMKDTLATNSVNNSLCNSINLLPPNQVTICSLKNILSRVELEKKDSDKKTNVESSISKLKTAGYNKAVENWCKRIFVLFSTSYILKGLEIEFEKYKEKLNCSDNQ